MEIEPFELKGKTIKDAYKTDSSGSNEEELVIEFTDGSKVMIYGIAAGYNGLGDTVFASKIIVQTDV